MSERVILQEVILNETLWRIHNVKIEKFSIEYDLPILFLSHYDSLPDDIKSQKPLTNYLSYINKKVTVDEACSILQIENKLLNQNAYIKIIGTCVLVWDDFPLALHLQFTNTAKDYQTLARLSSDAILSEAQNFLLCGNVYVLHKSQQKHQAEPVYSVDGTDDEFEILPQDTYSRLPNQHALFTTHLLNETYAKNPKLFEHLAGQITQRVMAIYSQESGV